MSSNNDTTPPQDAPPQDTTTSSTTPNPTAEGTTDAISKTTKGRRPALPPPTPTEISAGTNHDQGSNAAAYHALDRYRAALQLVKDLTDLQLLTKIGEHLDTLTMPNPTNALLLELDARIRLDELRRSTPALRADRLLEGAASIAQQAQAVVAALAEHSMSPSEANTALYALQVAASALRQLQPTRPVGRPPKKRPLQFQSRPKSHGRGRSHPQKRTSRSTPPKTTPPTPRKRKDTKP